MKPFNSLHMDIANVLIECASHKQVISYETLCQKVNYPSPRTIGRELGKISEFTNEKYGIFISVLVVSKETLYTDSPMPGVGFFTMYEEHYKGANMSNVAEVQRNKAFEQDWSNLLDEMRTADKF